MRSEVTGKHLARVSGSKQGNHVFVYYVTARNQNIAGQRHGMLVHCFSAGLYREETVSKSHQSLFIVVERGKALRFKPLYNLTVQLNVLNKNQAIQLACDYILKKHVFIYFHSFWSYVLFMYAGRDVCHVGRCNNRLNRPN